MSFKSFDFFDQRIAASGVFAGLVLHGRVNPSAEMASCVDQSAIINTIQPERWRLAKGGKSGVTLWLVPKMSDMPVGVRASSTATRVSPKNPDRTINWGVLVARETERCRSGGRESGEFGGVDGVCEVGFFEALPKGLKTAPRLSQGWASSTSSGPGYPWAGCVPAETASVSPGEQLKLHPLNTLWIIGVKLHMRFNGPDVEGCQDFSVGVETSDFVVLVVCATEEPRPAQ